MLWWRSWRKLRNLLGNGKEEKHDIAFLGMKISRSQFWFVGHVKLQYRKQEYLFERPSQLSILERGANGLIFLGFFQARGVINFSVLDGWWIEGCVEGLTGWAIGPSLDQRLDEQETRKRELSDLYNKLEYLIIPKFYQQRDTWIDLMKNSIGKVAYYFNTHRMMRRYATDAYLWHSVEELRRLYLWETD